MNCKGSAFSSFIIGAIIVLVILFIGGYVFVCEIMGSCSGPVVYSDVTSIEDSIKNAGQSPDGTVFSTKNVVIPKEYSFNSKQFSKILNVNEECVKLDFSPKLNSVEYLDSENEFSLKFNEETKTDFYIMCSSKSCESSCREFCCIATVGKSLALQDWVAKIE